MKLIDLLNKLANGEEVPKLKLEHSNDNDIGYELYMKIGQTSEYNFYECLNEEIEIIEEDEKIENLSNLVCGDNLTWEVSVNRSKINELIDEVNKLKGGNNE